MAALNRRKFIAAGTALAAGAALSALPSFAKEKMPPLVHHVFFWLKDPQSKADLEKLIAGVKTLSKIETVRILHVGVAASTKKREVVDNSWSVSELMFFDDVAGQEAYQKHPIHLEFVKNCSDILEKVVVYDVMEV